ncbi:MAG: cell division protein FtsZ [Candidatus Micrarchaeaceae archaeon]
MEDINSEWENNLDDDLFKPKILVCGIGGGGSNTVNRISRMDIKGAQLLAMNTESKHLNSLSSNMKKLLLGKEITRGMGAGGYPEIGRKAAELSRDDISRALGEVNLLFLTAGMGGGTGTGAAPIVAQLAKDKGAIVIGIVTFPFALERVRLDVAKKGIEELKNVSDTLIVIDNQRLVSVYRNIAIEQAFALADEITANAVKGITEMITTPSLMNLDFADVRTVIKKGGLAMISLGEGEGNDKIDKVVESTLKNRLLDVSYENAKGVLLGIIGGEELTIGEANEIGNRITSSVAPDANVTWGARIDPAYNGKVQVIAIFTGVKSPAIFGSSENKKENEDIGIPDIW